MRTLAEIFICMFAVYGMYSLILEICAFLSGKAHVVFALRADSSADAAQTEMDCAALRSRAIRAPSAESDPVIICDDTEMAERMRGIGYDVYLIYR